MVEISEDSRKIQLGSVVSDFNLISLISDEIRLSDFSGLVEIINFWATWCVPCKEEMPIFQSRFDNNRLVRGFPTTFIVDPDGIMRIHHIGIITDKQLDGNLETIW